MPEVLKLRRARLGHAVDEFQRLVRRQSRAFLPESLVAQMLAGEDDRTFGLQQLSILGAARANGTGATRPSQTYAFRMRHDAPGNRDTLVQKLRPAGMQRF